MDPNIGKSTIGKDYMANDKKTLLEEANVSAKRNLMSVGGCADTPVNVDVTGNTDGNRPCLGNGIHLSIYKNISVLYCTIQNTLLPG
jgi:hypothetical protein